MLGAVMFGHEQMQGAIAAINELAAEVGKPSWDWEAPAEDTELADAVASQASAGFTAAYQISDKMERQAAVGDVKAAAVDALASDEEDARWSADEVKGALSKLEKNTVRQRVIAGEPRIDGRDQKTVRPINVEVGVLPRAHGSAVFTRGETQAIVVTTLGTGRDAQIIDAQSRVSAKSRSCSITTSRRSALARPASSGRPSGAKSATASLPAVASRP